MEKPKMGGQCRDWLDQDLQIFVFLAESEGRGRRGKMATSSQPSCFLFPT